MRVESSPLLDRADAVWSNPLLRQMFILVPVLVDLAFQAGAGTLSDLGPWYPLGIALLAVGVALAATDVQVGRRWAWLPYLLPAIDFAAIGLMRMARRAGSHVASKAAAARTSGAIVKAGGSRAPTS